MERSHASLLPLAGIVVLGALGFFALAPRAEERPTLQAPLHLPADPATFAPDSAEIARDIARAERSVVMLHAFQDAVEAADSVSAEG